MSPLFLLNSTMTLMKPFLIRFFFNEILQHFDMRLFQEFQPLWTSSSFVKKGRVEWALEKENPSRARVLKKKPCDALIPVCLSNDKRLALKRLTMVRNVKNVSYFLINSLIYIQFPLI